MPTARRDSTRQSCAAEIYSVYSLAAAVKHLAHLGWQCPVHLQSHACLAPTAKQDAHGEQHGHHRDLIVILGWVRWCGPCGTSSMCRGKGMWRLVVVLVGQWTIASWVFTCMYNNNVNLLSVMSCYVKILMSRVIKSRCLDVGCRVEYLPNRI